MRKIFVVLALIAIAGCGRDHLRNYPLSKYAPVYIEDAYGARSNVAIGSRHVIRGDRETLVIIRDVRQERFPLLRGWHVEREDDSLTIEEIPTFKPY